ncbi:adenylyl cyclase [Mycobacterium tuberculosis variant bovis BCG]|nr:adenylyl cyclase [Mycobacterium tuberculosis variant bovis BCG]
MGVPAGTLRQVYDSLDFDALEAAGIANPRERAGLLTYLDELGFTVEEMVQAERRGRLFGLAGDVLLWSGPRSTPWRPRLTNWGCQPTTSHARGVCSASPSRVPTFPR